MGCGIYITGSWITNRPIDLQDIALTLVSGLIAIVGFPLCKLAFNWLRAPRLIAQDEASHYKDQALIELNKWRTAEASSLRQQLLIDGETQRKARRQDWQALSSEFRTAMGDTSVDWHSTSRDDHQRRTWRLRGYYKSSEKQRCEALVELAGQKVVESPALSLQYSDIIDTYDGDAGSVWYAIAEAVCGSELGFMGEESGEGPRVSILHGTVNDLGRVSEATCLRLASME
jgi:hypothetical protein